MGDSQQDAATMHQPVPQQTFETLDQYAPENASQPPKQPQLLSDRCKNVLVSVFVAVVALLMKCVASLIESAVREKENGWIMHFDFVLEAK
ncbi:hypothetical protein OROMI_028109 [Orobanche minor]